LKNIKTNIKSLLNLSSTKSIIVKNSFWLIFDQAIRMLFALIIGSWTARYLGKSNYGQISFVTSYLTLFQIISGLGMEAIVVRDLIYDRVNANKIIGSVFIMKLFTGVINWVLSIIFVIYLYGVNDETYILVFIAGLSLVFQSFSVIELWFQSNNKTFNIVLPKLIASVIINTLKIVFIVNGASIYLFIALYSIEFILSALFLFIALRRYPIQGKYKFDFTVSKKIFKDSWPFLVSAISIYLYTRFDMFIIKKELGSAELGIYNAAITISTLLPILPMIMLNVLNPILAKKKVESEELYQNYLKLTFRVFGYSGILFSVCVYFLSDFIVKILFGSDFAAATDVLKIHIFTNVFIYMGIAQNIWIVNENKGKINVYKTIVGIVLAIVFNLLLIPKYGVIGAAYSALIVQFISSFLINSILAPEAFRLQWRSLLIR
jgi:O-antigen/teichoic acid export membrane protein